jgi:hypothetical protein
VSTSVSAAGCPTAFDDVFAEMHGAIRFCQIA